MDNSKGEFEKITETKFEEQMQKSEPLVFKVGEIIEIRGSRLKVERIWKKKITFKLLPKLTLMEQYANLLSNQIY